MGDKLTRVDLKPNEQIQEIDKANLVRVDLKKKEKTKNFKFVLDASTAAATPINVLLLVGEMIFQLKVLLVCWMCAIPV